MDPTAAISEFLTSRRARIDPQEAGLPSHGTRRVPGLRREEVAVLASISLSYYTRIERGDATGISDSVLDAIAAALRLTEDERAHLDDLIRAANRSRPPRRTPPRPQVRPSVQRIVDSMVATPGFVYDRRLDILHANPLGRALFSPLYEVADQVPNHARFTFLAPQAQEFWRDWDDNATATVAILRAEAGRDPYDRQLSDLIGELSTRSDEFAARWAAHDVQAHHTTTMRLHHPVVGDLTLAKEILELDADGHRLVAYTAEPRSHAQEALDLLASWAATPADQPHHQDAPEPTSRPDE
jgi:transcriptional regulator with XRE-family HTH domain